MKPKWQTLAPIANCQLLTKRRCVVGEGIFIGYWALNIGYWLFALGLKERVVERMEEKLDWVRQRPMRPRLIKMRKLMAW